MKHEKAEKRSTEITDKNGTEIFEGDNLTLRFETITIIGKAKLDENGDWELYKDEGNHIEILHNQDRITIS